LAGGLASVKNSCAPQTNITIARMNGMPVQSSSSDSEPWMSAPTSPGFFRWYLNVNARMATDTSTAKNTDTPRMKKYSVSTSEATVDAEGGKRGKVLDI
jgi:hypothetical protein